MEKDVWLDPTAEEASRARGALTVACMPALGTMTSIWQTGQMTADEAIQVNDQSLAVLGHKLTFSQCVEECQARCGDIHDVVATALLNSQSTKTR